MKTVNSIASQEFSSYEKNRILLIGNDPAALSKLLDMLNAWAKTGITTEIAFDLRSVYQRLVRFKPNYILVDDNLGHTVLQTMIAVFRRMKKTREIPITILKSSNYSGTIYNGIQNYVLKQNLSAESLYLALHNSARFRRMGF